MMVLSRLEISRRYEPHRPPRSKAHKKWKRQYQRENKERNLLCQARYRAKKAGFNFNLELEDVNIPFRCPYLNVVLRSARGTGPRYNSPTLDRIDNNKGYVKGNVEVISYRANMLKRDLTLDEMYLMGAALVKRGRRP